MQPGNFERKFYWVLMLVMAIIILFMKSCSKPCPLQPVLIKSDTIWRVLQPETVSVDRPVPYEVIRQGKTVKVTVTDTVFLTEYVDTAFILKDYMATRKYRDTITRDSSSVIISENVNQNKLFDREIVFNLRYPTITHTLAQKVRNKVFMGLDIGGSNYPWVNGGLGMALLTKSDNLYTIRVGLTTQASWYAGGTLYWKIHF